ncbi:unnamed protein product [Caenorhabditis angaria]|uniref:Uncharacterized protein n=1 Tax=Caenorhabditis angaria TaxID=860376 RepID=A0A9P1I391_9PELO|nr:unnamed protein product [Caenorhabditis angaria]
MEFGGKNPQFDVIVADPPYGVREKARKIGNKEKPPKIEDVDYIRYPEKEEYNLENTYCDLLDLAANMCIIGGRVSFWYPVILADYCEENLPKHPAMRLIFNCEQGLTRKSSRRLLTYRKIREPQIDEETEISKTGVSNYRSVLFSTKN